MNDVLLLNADWTPMQVLPWKRTICLVLDEKVLTVSNYAGRMVRSPGFSMPWPAVVSLRQYVRIRFNVSLTRRNVLARDRFTCQYCAAQPKTELGRTNLALLTVDHVVPRSQSRNAMVELPWSGQRVPVGSWENLVASCVRCNQRKGARTPAEADMPLLRQPFTPGFVNMVSIALAEYGIPEEWQPFLPRESIAR